MSAQAQVQVQPQNKRKRPGSRLRALLGFIWYAFVVLGAMGVGTIAFLLGTSPVLRSIVAQKFSAEPPAKVFNTNSMNLLILGCDEDETMGGGKVLKNKARSDMMMVVRLDFQQKQVGAVSVPRDIYYQLKGYTRHKMNAYHAIGGDELSQKAVEALLKIKIDRTISLDFNAFQQLVNDLGGVPVKVEKQMDYDDNVGHLHIHLKPGDQTLNGYDAMGFVRFRHDDSDLYRAQRQHQFMMAFKQQMMRKPFAIGAVAQDATKMAGGALNDGEVASLVLFAQSVPKENVKLGSVPVVDGPKGGFWLDRKHLDKSLKDYLITDDEPEIKYNKDDSDN